MAIYSVFSSILAHIVLVAWKFAKEITLKLGSSDPRLLSFLPLHTVPPFHVHEVEPSSRGIFLVLNLKIKFF